MQEDSYKPSKSQLTKIMKVLKSDKSAIKVVKVSIPQGIEILNDASKKKEYDVTLIRNVVYSILKQMADKKEYTHLQEFILLAGKFKFTKKMGPFHRMLNEIDFEQIQKLKLDEKNKRHFFWDAYILYRTFKEKSCYKEAISTIDFSKCKIGLVWATVIRNSPECASILIEKLSEVNNSRLATELFVSLILTNHDDLAKEILSNHSIDKEKLKSLIWQTRDKKTPDILNPDPVLHFVDINNLSELSDLLQDSIEWRRKNSDAKTTKSHK